MLIRYRSPLFADECPLALGYQYVASANVCYKAITSTAARLSWMDAFLACQSDGGHLYIANTPQKLDVIATFLVENGKFLHHHHQSLNREGRWGTTDDFATSFLHFSLFSTALWDLPNCRPVHCLTLSSHFFTT